VFGPLASYVVILLGQMRFAIEREQAEANKDRLQSALDAARLGSWQYELLHRVFSLDERGKEIFAVAENTATVGASITRLIVSHQIMVIVHRNKYAMPIPQLCMHRGLNLHLGPSRQSVNPGQPTTDRN
jgi:hypothetical protein